LGLWLVLVGLRGQVVFGEAFSREYPLKAVFLLNFAHYTTWPTNAFAGPDSPFVIAVSGDDPFGKLLDDAVLGEKVEGRKIVVQRYRRAETPGPCQILFLGVSETRRLDRILSEMRGRPVLTVRDADSVAHAAIGVQFLTENNRIRLRINPQALRAAGLTMSSKLLRMAELIPPPDPRTGDLPLRSAGK
jgi:hypothetical protein